MQEEARVRAAEALNEMRKHPELGLSVAARRHHTTPQTVKTHFGHLLHRSSGGAYRAAASDRERFVMDVVGPTGPVERGVRGSRARALNLEHHRALAVFAGPGGGDEAILARFRGKRIAGVELLTDPDLIERLADAGEFEFLDFQSF